MNIPEWLMALILGIVEGATEFIPVSSTGHLILTGQILNYHGEKAAAFEVVIQIGAILAIVFAYKERFIGFFVPDSHRAFSGRRAIVLLILTSLPALILGFFSFKIIKSYLFGIYPVAWAWLLGGIAILLIEQKKFSQKMTSVDDIDYKTAFHIGLWQCLAMCPGVSRSASTIIGGLFCGLDRKTSAEYSFFAAVPILMCAAGYDIYKTDLTWQDSFFFLQGGVFAFLSALLAIRTFLPILAKYTLAPFAYYRILLGIVVLAFLYTK